MSQALETDTKINNGESEGEVPKPQAPPQLQQQQQQVQPQLTTTAPKMDFYPEFRKAMCQVFQKHGFNCDHGNPFDQYCNQFVMSHGDLCLACCFGACAPPYFKINVAITGQGTQLVTVCISQHGQTCNMAVQGYIGAARSDSKFSKLKADMGMNLMYFLNNNRAMFHNAPQQIVVV